MRALWVVVLVWVAACDSDKPRVAEPQQQPVAACFGDELGALRTKWTERDVCNEEDLAKCREACDAGDGDACFSLGVELQTRNHPESDDDLDIRQLYARACKLGLAIGCTNWAAGQLFRTDAPDARCLYRVFQRTCDVDESFGCSMAARILIQWPRTPFDPWIGYSQLVNACDRLDGPPCRFLAWYLEGGRFGGASPAAIKALLLRACDGGDVEACDRERAEDAMTD